MNRASADRNLLLALLALQTNLIDPTAIVAAFNAWTRDKARSMGEIFVDQGVIDSAQCEVLELLVDVHVRKHAGDVEKSLAAIGSSDVALLSLGAIADPDLGASLAAVGIRREQDISDTRTYLAPPAAPSRRFKILRLHARGGLGEVFVASDEELHREVALKQIQDAHADEADSRFRFVVEAEITGGLEHPGIVPVYGLGHYDDGRPYYAMRFIRGESLREAIKKFHQAEGSNRDPGARSLALRQLLRRFLDVCNAVAYAHSRGVLHRDLKPSNVMLGPYGETLVVDWGLAKVIGRSEVVSDELTLRPPSGSDVQATRAGVAIGTLSYMSPEQARGDLDRLGPASDVYSLGATLYHVLTGREPFSGGDAADLQAKVIVGDYPPPRQVLASIPAAMEAVCIKAMAREAGARYSSPRALADDVEHWMADEPVSAWREPWATRLARWGRRHRSAVAVAAGVLVVAALGLYIARLRVDRARTAAALEQEETQHYVNRFVLAEREWQAVNVRRAEQLLDECPQTRRGWEWRYLKRLCHQDLRTIAGHTDDVWCVSVSPDGNWIASASLDKTVRLWDARSFQCVPTLQHPLQVYNVAFSPDGRHLASIAAVPSQPGEVTIWDVGTGAKLKVLPAQNGIAGYVAFSPDGRRLASTSGEREGTHEVVVWDLATDEKVVTFAGHDDAVNAVAFSPDGQRIASASGNQDYTAVEKKLGVVHVWDAASGAVLSTFRGHTDSIIGLAFRPPDGRQIASASWDRTVKLWDAATAAEVRTFRGHTHFVDGVVFRHDGRQLASSGEDGAVKLWDADTGLEMRTFRGHTGVVQSLAYSPDGTRLYSASYDRTLKVWDTAGSGDAGSLGGFNWWINSVAYSADGDRLAAAGGVDRSVKVWDPKSTRETLRLDALPGPAWGVAFSPDRRRLAAALGDWRVTDRPGVVKVWDAADGRELLSLAAHQGVAWCVAFSPDGRLLASSGGEAGTPDVVTLWDVATGREIHSLRGHQGGIRVVAFSPDGKSLASASEEVKIWEVRSGREIRTLRGQTGAFSALAYSPDGRRVASGGSDAIVRIWDVATGREIFHLQGHTHQVFGLAFHPNDNRLASGSFDGTVKLWDTAIGQEILTLRGNAGAILSVAFSPDGQQLASGGYDKNVKIWDATPLEDPNSP